MDVKDVEEISEREDQAAAKGKYITPKDEHVDHQNYEDEQENFREELKEPETEDYMLSEYAVSKPTKDAPHHYGDEELKENGSDEFREQSGQRETLNTFKPDHDSSNQLGELERPGSESAAAKTSKKEKSWVDFYWCRADDFAATWQDELQQSQKELQQSKASPFLVTTFCDKGIYSLVCSKECVDSKKSQGLSFGEKYVMRKFAGVSVDEEVFQENLNFFLK